MTVCGDDQDEGDQTFTLVLTSPTGGAALGAHATATVTVRENDTTPSGPS